MVDFFRVPLKHAGAVLAALAAKVIGDRLELFRR
jgi:hypothetical protein